MNKKRAVALFLAVPIIVVLSLISTPSLVESEAIKTPAYQACRQKMINKEGYGVWKFESARFLPYYAQFLFRDGTNFSFCRTIGIGRFWHVTLVGETIALCELDFGAPQVKECPRGKFGVSP